jgi:hypothetical protein
LLSWFAIVATLAIRSGFAITAWSSLGSWFAGWSVWASWCIDDLSFGSCGSLVSWLAVGSWGALVACWSLVAWLASWSGLSWFAIGTWGALWSSLSWCSLWCLAVALWWEFLLELVLEWHIITTGSEVSWIAIGAILAIRAWLASWAGRATLACAASSGGDLEEHGTSLASGVLSLFVCDDLGGRRFRMHIAHQAHVLPHAARSRVAPVDLGLCLGLHALHEVEQHGEGQQAGSDGDGGEGDGDEGRRAK